MSAFTDALIARISNLISETQEMLSDAHPQPAGRDALTHILAKLEASLRTVTLEPPESPGEPASVSDARKKRLLKPSRAVSQHIQHLGFLRRASQTRNAFELYRPLTQMATQMLTSDVKVILSSEWLYSPFIKLPDSDSDSANFIYIGFPASEAGNPLVIPLAGHEIGHALWRKLDQAWAVWQNAVSTIGRLENKCDKTKEEVARLEDAIQKRARYENSFGVKIHRTAQKFGPLWSAKRQIEEVFCDFVGIYLFGAAYIRAFHYLAAPNVCDEVQENYPRMAHRFDLMLYALRRLAPESAREGDADVCGPDRFKELRDSLIDEKRGSEERNALADICKNAIESEKEFIADCVKFICENKGFSPPSLADAIVVREWFKKGAPPPASVAKNVPTVILGGWLAYDDNELFKDDSTLTERRSEIIKELSLKSIELIEIETYRKP